MGICPDCSQDFWGLTDDGRSCNKCTLLAATNSDIDKAVLRDKNQCKSCSLVYGQLRTPLCFPCCKKYAEATHIPPEVATHAVAADQILTFQSSNTTSEIWDLVAGHRPSVSQHRLGLAKPRAQNPSLLKAQAARLKPSPGISTGTSTKSQQQLQALRDQKNIANKVKFTVSLSKAVPKPRGGTTMVVVPEVRFTELFNDQDSIDSALDKVVAKVQEYHHTSFALEAMIYRDMVTFYAFITATNIFRIPAHVAEGGTVLDFFYYFREQNHLTQVQIETKALSLRVSVPDLSVATGNFTTGSSVAPSAKPRSSSGPSRAVEIRKSKPEPSKQVRRSAYVPIRQMIVPPPPPRLFARDPQMISYKFHRYVVSIDPSNPTQVEFFLPQDTPIETISIAADWADGMEKAKQGLPFHQTGYIGSGSAKQVIYARAHIGDADDEYALGQSSDPGYPDHDHYLMLAQELRNLHFGEAMRKEFEELARDAQTPLSGK
ncbi:hypothetical protein GGX14DRAFT_571813 [Mycena pura]|uniref:Uncharacterized protein n=1 Tax=Mycena pura TaxID=153505 RepID=A0AAD6Y9I0_9AGAR|nr:hypothetical protein GGX14DRAFT_571813 [Mycena pura]